MADEPKTVITMADAVKDKDCKVYVDAVPMNAREVMEAHTHTFDGRDFKSFYRTELGGFKFRKLNEGVKTSLPKFDVRRFEVAVGTEVVPVDVSIDDLYENQSGIPELMARQKQGVIDAAVVEIGRQFYYGTDIDEDGLTGLLQLVPESLVFDAGGKEEDDGALTSVWLIGFGEEGVSIAYGGGKGKVLKFSDPYKAVIPDEKGKLMPAIVSDFNIYPTVLVRRPNCIARIANVKALDDDLFYDVIAQCEEQGFVPTVAYCRPKALNLLRNSRTAVNATGVPAPTPTDVAGGLPIRTTLSISYEESFEPDALKLN